MDDDKYPNEWADLAWGVVYALGIAALFIINMYFLQYWMY